jgi:ATP-dependent Zn protease
VDQTYERVRALLSTKKDALLRAAAALKQRETLQGEELRALLAGEMIPIAAAAAAPRPGGP